MRARSQARAEAAGSPGRCRLCLGSRGTGRAGGSRRGFPEMRDYFRPSIHPSSHPLLGLQPAGGTEETALGLGAVASTLVTGSAVLACHRPDPEGSASAAATTQPDSCTCTDWLQQKAILMDAATELGPSEAAVVPRNKKTYLSDHSEYKDGHVRSWVDVTLPFSFNMVDQIQF